MTSFPKDGRLLERGRRQVHLVALFLFLVLVLVLVWWRLMQMVEMRVRVMCKWFFDSLIFFIVMLLLFLLWFRCVNMLFCYFGLMISVCYFPPRTNLQIFVMSLYIPTSTSVRTYSYAGVGHRPHSLSYFPFSTGKRTCLGRGLALQVCLCLCLCLCPSLCLCLCLCLSWGLRVYISILVVSCFVWSGALVLQLAVIFFN